MAQISYNIHNWNSERSSINYNSGEVCQIIGNDYVKFQVFSEK